MHILTVHNRYKFRGGEDVVFEEEYNLLKKYHDIDRYEVDNSDKLTNPFDYLKLVFTTHYSKKGREKISELLSRKRYDILHVHNFFPLLTPAVFDAARDHNVATVLSLHNYRLIHPNGLLEFNGKIDERSVRGSAYRCVWDGVYRHSRFQTAVVAHMIEYHRKHKTWHTKVDRFIALTNFAKNKFADGGVPPDKIVVKPNSIDDYYDGILKGNERKIEDYFIYVGRISEEKGIEILLKCWQSQQIEQPLFILGNGPLRERLIGKTRKDLNIVWLDEVPHREVFEYISKAKALIFPSLWYEGFPLTILEAFSMGTPVIASDLGSQAEIVDHEINGLHFKSGDVVHLAKMVRMLNNDPGMIRRLGEGARKKYVNHYTPEKNYKRLIDIYDQAMEVNCDNFKF